MNFPATDDACIATVFRENKIDDISDKYITFSIIVHLRLAQSNYYYYNELSRVMRMEIGVALMPSSLMIH